MMVWLRQSKYGYIWVTFAFFLISFIGQWLFGWFAYVNEQTDIWCACRSGGLRRSFISRHTRKLAVPHEELCCA